AVAFAGGFEQEVGLHLAAAVVDDRKHRLVTLDLRMRARCEAEGQQEGGHQSGRAAWHVGLSTRERGWSSFSIRETMLAHLCLFNNHPAQPTCTPTERGRGRPCPAGARRAVPRPRGR